MLGMVFVVFVLNYFFFMSVYLLTAINNALLFQTIMGAWALWDYYAYAEPIEAWTLFALVGGTIVLTCLNYLLIRVSYQYNRFHFTGNNRFVYHSEYAPIPFSIPVSMILKIQPVVIRRFLLPERVGLRLSLGGWYAYWPFPVIVYPENEDAFIREMKERNPVILISDEVLTVSFKSA